MSLKDILERGQWSEPSTWQRHYNKKIVNTRESPENTVILNKSSVDAWFPILERLVSIVQR